MPGLPWYFSSLLLPPSGGNRYFFSAKNISQVREPSFVEITSVMLILDFFWASQLGCIFLVISLSLNCCPPLLLLWENGI